MAVRDSKTEQQIKDAAKKLFFAEGRFNATTQEISDAAGVNRTLVNYYFRSRDTLFDLVLKDARAAMQVRLESYLAKTNDLRAKLAHVIDVYMEHAIEYPYIDTYILSRFNESADGGEEVLEEGQNRIKVFLQEIQAEMNKGRIQKMDPRQFFINFASLMSNPICFSPVYRKMLNISDKQYKQMVRERKDIILNMLFIK